MMNRLVAVALMGLCAVPAVAQQQPERVPRPTPSAPAQEWVEPVRSQANLDALSRVQVKTYDFKDAGNPKMEYRLYVPTKYDKAKPTPLVIALHGLGSGTVYMMEYSNLAELAERYGYIVATPMGFNERSWYGARGQGNAVNGSDPNADAATPGAGHWSELDVLNVLDIVKHDYNVDSHRTYLIGQSMGGGGTLYLGSKYADKWTALAAMAPAIYMSPDTIAGAKNLPVMVVQGDADQSVNAGVTRQWVAKMKELGMKYEYIEVPGGTHASAGRLNIDKVFAFLDKQRKP